MVEGLLHNLSKRQLLLRSSNWNILRREYTNRVTCFDYYHQIVLKRQGKTTYLVVTRIPFSVVVGFALLLLVSSIRTASCKKKSEDLTCYFQYPDPDPEWNPLTLTKIERRVWCWSRSTGFPRWRTTTGMNGFVPLSFDSNGSLTLTFDLLT